VVVVQPVTVSVRRELVQADRLVDEESDGRLEHRLGDLEQEERDLGSEPADECPLYQFYHVLHYVLLRLQHAAWPPKYMHQTMQ